METISRVSNKQRSETTALVDKWRPRLLLGEWFFEIVYADKDIDGSHTCNVLAEVHSDPTYLKATITIYPAYLAAPPDIRERALVHEMCHCLTEEFKRLGEDLLAHQVVTAGHFNNVWERLTQRVANVSMGGYNDLVSRS